MLWNNVVSMVKGCTYVLSERQQGDGDRGPHVRCVPQLSPSRCPDSGDICFPPTRYLVFPPVHTGVSSDTQRRRFGGFTRCCGCSLRVVHSLHCVCSYRVLTAVGAPRGAMCSVGQTNKGS